MLKRAILAVAFAAALLAPSALAANVHVRVEGKTQTLWGALEPTVSATTPLDALEQASLAGEFYYHVTQSSFGQYVDQVGRYGGTGSVGWVFKVDSAVPPVGADKVQLKDGDTILWYFADFSSGAGPKTLQLRRGAANCYLVSALDDNGSSSAPVGAVLHVGSKRVVPTQGAAGSVGACVGPHKGLLVRATLAGAVRSNALA
ncbi:MAG TPA: DUF4430 domain-containing protein [Gaiellaceae bacterium]|nr:DUF4430 domain-containing protein [Gaiellaceae bacterium]